MLTRSRPRRHLTMPAAAIMAATLVAGCNSDANNASGQRSDETTNTTAEGEIEPGGSLVYGQAVGISQLDPNTIASGGQTQLQTLLWSALTKLDRDGAAVPDIAESWTTSDDGLTWTFDLRPDVTYHDGTPFTAQDAVQNIERVLDPEIPSQTRTKIEMIEKVAAPDDTTLVVDLSQPNPTLPLALVDVKMSDVENIEEVNQTANGTGPYKLKSFVPDQAVEMVRFDGYYGDKPNLDEIKIVRYPDMTAAQAAFRAGELGLLWNVPPDAIDDLAVSADAQVLEAEEPSGAFVLELDTTSEPFSDIQARRALAYAVDRETMLDVAYAGRGIANEANNIVNPENEYYAPSGLAQYEQDLDKAKELFEAAGVDKLTYWTTPDFAEWTTMGQVLQQDLASIDVKLEIKENEISAWVAQFYPAGKEFPGMVVPNFLSFPPLPADYALQWFSSTGTCECNWVAPREYDEAAQVAARSSDEAERAQSFAAMQKILSEQVPVVVVANTAFLSVAEEELRGAWVQADGTVHLEDAGYAAGAGND